MTRSPIFDHLAEGLTKVIGLAQDARGECRHFLKDQILSALEEADLPSREELEVLRALVSDLQVQNKALQDRVQAIEGKDFPSGGG